MRVMMGALFTRASQHFVDLDGQVPGTAWSAPTPCSDWDVRALVDHFVRWNTFMPQLLEGKSVNPQCTNGSDIVAATSVAAGGSRDVAFNRVGTFLYECLIHPWMRTTITVRSR